LGNNAANGISRAMLQVIMGHQRSHARQNILVNYRDWFWAHLPGKVFGAWAGYLSHLDDMTLFDLLWSLSEALPAGLYDGLALERFVRKLLCGDGRCNSFEELGPELYIIATDLDTGERVVFGRGEHKDVPVSMAVAASSALPLVYKPVRIGEKEYVDGGLRGNASLDLAIEQGATLVVCINPMVPFDKRKRDPSAGMGMGSEYLSDRGIRLVADQTLRITGHSGLQYHIKQLRRRHPEVDIILIEPRPGDREMFFYIYRFQHWW
jgi:predicted acylesterase/phospholipase RssA